MLPSVHFSLSITVSRELIFTVKIPCLPNVLSSIVPVVSVEWKIMYVII